MLQLRDRVAIVGIGETEYVRRSSKDIKSLVLQAVEEALHDAQIKPKEVDGIITDPSIVTRLFPHDELAHNLGISRAFDATFSISASAGSVCSPLVAAMAIESGLANVVLCYFGLNFGSVPGGAYAFHENWPFKLSFEKPFGFWGQPSYFAAIARRYKHEFGLTGKQLGSIAVTQRRHALLNGRAQMRKPLTYQDYERSPLVSDPLRVPDCCLNTDGAAAFVMCSVERAKDCPRPPVYAMGVGFASSPVGCSAMFTQPLKYTEWTPAREATAKALQMAGISLKDVDFAEIYDCFTISCLLQIEDIGFCMKGEGGAFVEGGHNALGGSLPINTHGGHLSHGYLMGITHLIEAVRQLRGEAGAAQVRGAEIGLVGALAVNEYGTLILRRP